MSMNLAPIAYSAGIAGSSQGAQGIFPYGFYQLKDSVTGLTVGASYPGNVILSAAATPINPATDDTLQALLNATRALTAALNAAILQNAASLAALIATLPTTQPATTGQLWLDGNVLALS